MGSKNSRVIVNIAVAPLESWYHRGQVRLLQSLTTHRNDSHLLFKAYEHPIFTTPYADKIWSIYEAYLHGFKHILYLDCSITAVKNTEAIWNYIEEHGYYLYASGANCAQTCNDKSLAAYNLTRDQAEHLPECASNVFGVNVDSEFGESLITSITDSLSNGAIYGEKWPSNEQRLKESTDPRYLYHRQDQSVISLVAGIIGLPMEQEGHFVSRAENADQTMNNNVIFSLKGGY
jgi:hypothetical protein